MKKKYNQNCLSCLSNMGKKRISPVDPIYNGKYWIAEHTYPCGLLGWIVLLPKRHVEALHELTKSEHEEFAEIYPKIIKALHKETNCKKEYIFQIAKAKRFKHVHYHIVPRAHNLPKEYWGIKIFNLKNDAKSLSEERVSEFCKKMRKRVNTK